MSDQTQDSFGTPRPSVKENIKTGSTWKRGLYMLLFAIIYGIAELVLFAVILFQFVSMVLLQKTNERLIDFSRELIAFIREIYLYLTYNSEDKPFPYREWPSEGASPETIEAVVIDNRDG